MTNPYLVSTCIICLVVLSFLLAVALISYAVSEFKTNAKIVKYHIQFCAKLETDVAQLNQNMENYKHEILKALDEMIMIEDPSLPPYSQTERTEII